jgi:5-methylthioadenosine/S-adenosylhomocysteine deaminase
VAKASAADASVLGADETFPMGTARGGEILGLPVGRIAADHAADLVVVDLNELSLQPARTAPQQIVYAMQPQAIRRVLVGGEPIVEDGWLVNVDQQEIVSRVRAVTAEWEPALAQPAASGS